LIDDAEVSAKLNKEAVRRCKMFSRFGRWMSALTAVLCVLIVLAPAVLAAGPDGTSPGSAMAPSGQWKALGLGGEDWYAFQTPGTAANPSQVTIEMQVAPVNSAVFSVWDAERLNEKANAGRGEIVQPLGAGSAEPLDKLGFVQKLVWSGAMTTSGPFYVSVKQTGNQTGGYVIKISGDKLTFPAMPEAAAQAPAASKPAAKPAAAAKQDGSGPDNAFTATGEWKPLGVNEGHWYVFNSPGADSKGNVPQVTVELQAIPPGSASFCVWTPEGLRIWKTGAEDETTLPVGRGSAVDMRKGDVAQTSVWSGQFNMAGPYYVCVRQTGLKPSTYKLDVTVK
jgi:hypothetical protein